METPLFQAILGSELAAGDLIVVRDVSVTAATGKDKKLAWSELVSAITAAVGGSGGVSLPSQEGQAGKALSTNGSELSWGHPEIIEMQAADQGLPANNNQLRFWFDGTDLRIRLLDSNGTPFEAIIPMSPYA